MVKRGAENELTKDNYEQHEDDDDNDAPPDASSVRASEEILAKRRILALPRTADGRVDLTKKATVKKNPLANVDLTGGMKHKTETSQPSDDRCNDTHDRDHKNDSNKSKEQEKDSTMAPFAFAGGGFAAATTTNGAPSGFGASTFGGSFQGATGFAAAFTNTSASNTGFGRATSSTAATTSDDTTADTKPGFGFGQFAGSSAFVFGGSTTNDEASSLPTSNSKPLEPSKSAVVTLPSDYTLQSGEEDETVLLSLRCKTFRWASTNHVAAPAATASVVQSVPPSTSMQTSFTTTRKTESHDQDGATTLEGASASQDANAEPNVAASTSPTNVNKTDSSPATPQDSSASTTVRDFSWHEVGIGPLKFLQHSTHSNRLRLVQRRESTPNGHATKTILNVPLWKESVMSQPSEKHVKLTSLVGTETHQYLFKFKLTSEASDLFRLLTQKGDEQAKSCFATLASGGEKDKSVDSDQTQAAVQEKEK